MKLAVRERWQLLQKCPSKKVFVAIILLVPACILVVSNLEHVKLYFTIIHVYRAKCVSKPERLDVSTLQCPFPHVDKITIGKGQDQPIVLTFASKAWLNITKNWIYHVRRMKYKNQVVASLSDGLCNHLQGAYCWYPNTTHSIDKTLFKSTKEGAWKTKLYKRIITDRMPVIYSILKCNRSIIFSDNDVVFLKNPVDYLQEKAATGGDDKGGYDMIFQRGSGRFKILDWLGEKGWLGNFLLCMGFSYMRPTPATFQFLEGVMAYQDLDWDDQFAANICLLFNPRVKLRWMTLPPFSFLNGWRLIHERWKTSEWPDFASLSPYTCHFDWLHNITAKVSWMKKIGVWNVTS